MPKNPHSWLLADLASARPNGFRVFSTFSCGGGSCMGYKLAGYDVVAANDIDRDMAAHYRDNLAPRHFFECPIGDLVAREGDKYKVDLPAELLDIDVLEGSPPCSVFSLSGSRDKAFGREKTFREGQKKQVLSDLFFDYLGLVARVRPKVSVAENVPGMLMGNAKGYVRAVHARYRELGYRPQLFLVNAADAGVPQARRRVFFVAVRDDLAAAAALKPLALDLRCRHVSTMEAITDVQGLTPEEVANTAPLPQHTRWWHLTRPGDKFAKSVVRAGLDSSLWNWVRMPAHRPAATLIATHWCLSHPTVCRRLTYREFLRLGSFPDDYRARTMDIGKYIVGMSVPPRLAQAVGAAVAEQWLKPLARHERGASGA